MSDAHHFLQNLALVLCVAAATSLVFRALRQPVIFGYLMAGLIIGPHIPVPVVADEALVRTLSELGVILLMFGLGLEFSFRKLLRVGPTAGAIAILETSAMMLLGFAVGRAFGWSDLASVYTGAIIAISSTSIIIKAFAARPVPHRVRDLVFGILIIEDLIAIFLLALLTTVSTGDSVSLPALARTGMRLAAFLVGLVGVGLLVVPRLVRAALRLESPETTLVLSVGIAFATALLALAFGYSVALGAFIGGVLVAESGRARRVEHLVTPVRDMFAAIFFVAVGMMINPALVLAHWPAVVVLTMAVLAGKVLAVTVGTFLTGFGTRTALQTGMSLAQIGEFSFIIASVGVATGAMPAFLYPVAIAVSALTTLTTPWLIRSSGPSASWVDRTLPRPLQTFASLYETWLDRLRHRPRAARSPVRRTVWLLVADAVLLAAIIVGAAVESGPATTAIIGLTGWTPVVARRAILALAVVVALPLLLGFFRTARKLGTAWASDVLPAPAPGRVDFAAAPRRALIVTLQLAIVVAFGVPLLAITQPFLPPYRGPLVFAVLLLLIAVAWWRSTTNLRGHAQAGAEVIVSALGKQMARAEPEGAPAAPAEPTPLRDVHQLLPGLGEPVALRIDAHDALAGETLGAIDLRSRTGAVVLAITRGGQPILLPTGHERILDGDLVALAGTRDAVRRAAALIRHGG